MKRIVGFLLLVSGWPIAFAAVGLLGFGPAQFAFLLTAMAIQAAGLVFVARSYLPRGSRAR